jgi:N-formylglutamate amidohydrolase
MRIETGTEPHPEFEIVEPARLNAPVVFNSPHSGARYSAAFLASVRLDALALRRSEDAFVDELFLAAVDHGAPLMRAHFPRAYLDVNREPYELDPRMFDGRLPAYANTRSLRVAGGLGTIARVVGDAQEIYDRRLPVEEAIRRIETLYKPYHSALEDLLARVRDRFGAAVLVDCHSMPSAGLAREERQRADIVLGDRYGTSCSPGITDLAEVTLRGLGFSVARNRPYAGGYITEHYGTPVGGIHALQIEINRALYMDEKTHERTAGFAVLCGKIGAFAEQLVLYAQSELQITRAAAE